MNRTTRRDVVYGTAEGVRLTLDLHFPKTRSAGPWPLVVAIHGGGWSEGDKAGFDLPQARGRYLVASVNYRMYPAFRFPAMIQDVKLAVRWLRAHAEELGMDPGRVAVLGHSAGAHLAALAALAGPEAGWDTGAHTDQSSAVTAAVVLAGPYDLTRRFGDEWADGLRHAVFGPRQWAAASPALRARGDAPPFLIVHGAADAVVEAEHARLFHDALCAAGAPSELLVLTGAGHGLDPVRGPRPVRALRAAMTMARLSRTVMAFLEHRLQAPRAADPRCAAHLRPRRSRRDG